MKGYFDENATTPMHPAAVAAMREAEARYWHNPSALYQEAARAKLALEDARGDLADYLQTEPEEIVFTSGATEANNAVVSWAKSRGRDIWFSQLEHPSFREPAEFHGRQGGGIFNLRVAEDGVIDRGFLSATPPVEGTLVSLMAANNETGILQPWPEVAAWCIEHNLIFHCDAAQWIGKLPPVDWGKCDFLTGSAHKFGGPKGVGFLRVSSRVGRFLSQRGGPQESRRRAGTENLPSILGMVAALKSRPAEISQDGRNAFETVLQSGFPGVRIIGKSQCRLPNTSLFILPFGKNTQWVARLSRRGYALSTGSACSAGQGASEVLLAMGVPAEQLGRVLRASGGGASGLDDWNGLAGEILAIAEGWDARG